MAKLQKGTGWGPDILDALGLVDKEPTLSEIYKYIPYLQNSGFTYNQIQDILNAYYESDASFLGIDLGFIDTMQINQDIAGLLKALESKPEAPTREDFLTSARAQIDAENAAMYADLDKLLQTNTDLYNEEMANISKNYTDVRNNLLSQQYQQNAQLMDTLQSSMDRSRRNALESGASAGIRIAENINNLLTVQNKQSSVSMDTANQLSQMMINQRNAEHSAKSAYNNALAQDTSNRHNIKLSSEDRASSLASTNYDAAYNSYSQKQQDWDRSLYSNPLYDYRKLFESKYSKGEN